ncbi:MAG: calcium-binding protein, partial [Pseudomonadota bacterium]
LFGSLGDDVLLGLSETGEDDGVVDFLNGGDGDDTILAGANDVVSGGDGDDTFQVGDWNAEGGPAQVTDFEEGRDNLVVLYEEGASEPDITIEAVEDNDDLYRIMADGEVIAEVQSKTTITHESIALVSQSAA